MKFHSTSVFNMSHVFLMIPFQKGELLLILEYAGSLATITNNLEVAGSLKDNFYLLQVIVFRKKKKKKSISSGLWLLQRKSMSFCQENCFTKV